MKRSVFRCPLPCNHQLQVDIFAYCTRLLSTHCREVFLDINNLIADIDDEDYTREEDEGDLMNFVRPDKRQLGSM